ncbi:ATP-binding cassette domain-containing protein [Arvimicrobium flavum]|uniref:ATP-binding cassette domain-containing protein n=1 Tax=Arvimicrobium flavum TaxID=3393320 RepID=UPI00237B5A71|nr:ATP-binding cassette domain-containing protein [Mesorhizobium shangrilense]
MSAALLKVEGLTKRFRRTGVTITALDDVSLSLRPGETLALVGASGSGKSTLARAILRLLEPDAGTVSFDGTDLLALRGAALRAMRAQLQMVFQDPHAAFNPRATVARAIDDLLRIHRITPRAERPRRIAALLERVGLSPALAERNIHDISGGQRQRVAIARAIASEPKLIVLDEAVSALDVSVRAKVLGLLAELQRERDMAYLFVTHDFAVVRQIAHRVAVMEHGRIVETAPAADLVASPQSEAARALVAAVPRLRYQPDQPMENG